VIFDLFNEPYPEKAAANGNEAEGWQCWLHGGQCTGISYPVAGMQSMVDAVRSVGANNVLMLGGLEWSNDLTGWLAHEPVDPDHNLVHLTPDRVAGFQVGQLPGLDLELGLQLRQRPRADHQLRRPSNRLRGRI
jgi:hypothetical protein